MLRVQEVGTDDAYRHRSLIHGTILHGSQYLSPAFRQQPATYYTATSGVGRALEAMHPTMTPLKVGVIGLGTGTIAAYGAKGDVYRFYDINPAVMKIADEYFSYLGDSSATIEKVLGDARLSRRLIALARRHGLTPQQLYRWSRRDRDQVDGARGKDASFAPVLLEPAREDQ